MTTTKNLSSSSIILALDTCTESCSAALLSAGVIYSEQAIAPREHSQQILPMIDSILRQANITMDDVQVIAYGRGPGSFTGIRICTSITQGLALGQDIPVIGISTLATMAQIAINNAAATRVLCAIDARMNEVYWGQFILDNGIAKLLEEERVSSPDDLSLSQGFLSASSGAILCCGSGFDTYPNLLSLDNKFPTAQLTATTEGKYPIASSMLDLAIQGIRLGHTTSVDEVTPIYLRDKVTWNKLPGRD